MTYSGDVNVKDLVAWINSNKKLFVLELHSDNTYGMLYLHSWMLTGLDVFGPSSQSVVVLFVQTYDTSATVCLCILTDVLMMIFIADQIHVSQRC